MLRGGEQPPESISGDVLASEYGITDTTKVSFTRIESRILEITGYSRVAHRMSSTAPVDLGRMMHLKGSNRLKGRYMSTDALLRLL